MTTAIALEMFGLLQQPGTAGKSLAGRPCTGAELIGTWQLAQNGGQPPPSEYTFYKHLTPTHFVVESFDGSGRVSYSHGGTYTVSGGKYTESITHGFGEVFENWGRSNVLFDCRTETDRLHIVGNDGAMDEVWAHVATGSK